MPRCRPIAVAARAPTRTVGPGLVLALAVAGALALLCLRDATALPSVQRVSAERLEIAQKRSAVEVAFAKAREDCARNFAVTACIDTARAQRREARLVLIEREQALATFERSERALARERALAQKQAELAARSSLPAGPATPASALSGARIRSAPSAGTGPRSAASAAAPAASTARPVVRPGSAAERRRRAEFETRERAAQAHRVDVEQRNALRAAKKKRAAALPSPASAPASSASR